MYDENDDEPFKPRTETAHQISITISPHMVTDLEDSKDPDLMSQPLHPLYLYDKLEPLQPLALQKVRYLSYSHIVNCVCIRSHTLSPSFFFILKGTLYVAT